MGGCRRWWLSTVCFFDGFGLLQRWPTGLTGFLTWPLGHGRTAKHYQHRSITFLLSILLFDGRAVSKGSLAIQHGQTSAKWACYQNASEPWTVRFAVGPQMEWQRCPSVGPDSLCWAWRLWDTFARACFMAELIELLNYNVHWHAKYQWTFYMSFAVNSDIFISLSPNTCV